MRDKEVAAPPVPSRPPAEFSNTRNDSMKSMKLNPRQVFGPKSTQNSGRKIGDPGPVVGRQHRRIKSNIVENLFKKMGKGPSSKLPTDGSLKGRSPEGRDSSEFAHTGPTEGDEWRERLITDPTGEDNLEANNLPSNDNIASDTQILANIQSLNRIFLDAKLGSNMQQGVNIYNNNYGSANPTPQATQPAIPFFNKKAIISKIESMAKKPLVEIEVGPGRFAPANKRSLEATPTSIQSMWKVNQLFEGSRLKNARSSFKGPTKPMDKHPIPSGKGPSKKLMEQKIQSLKSSTRLSFRESPSKDRGFFQQPSIKELYTSGDDDSVRPSKAQHCLASKSRENSSNAHTSKQQQHNTQEKEKIKKPLSKLVPEKSDPPSNKKSHKKNVLSVQITNSAASLISSLKLPLQFGGKLKANS